MRLPNGAGSVYKLKDKKRRRPWVAMVSQGYDSKGKLKRSPVGYYATRLEAEEAISQWRKHPTTKFDMTVEEVYAEWLQIHSRNVGESATQGYTTAWNHLSTIKGEKMRSLRTGQMQEEIDNVRVNGIAPSHALLAKIKALLSMLMDYSIKNDIITTNYARFIKLPKKAESDRTAFTDIELAKMEKAAGVIPNADTILVLCYTGFRINEFLSLTKFSYDPVLGTLTGGSKTDAGKDRTIPVHSKIRPIIDKWYKSSGDFLFHKSDGSKYSANYYRNHLFYPILEAIGIEKKTPHCTRHTFASLLHAAKVDPVEIQKLLGHSDYSMTANVYTHVDVEGLRKAVEAIKKC